MMMMIMMMKKKRGGRSWSRLWVLCCTYLWGLRFDLAGTSKRTVDFSHNLELCKEGGGVFFYLIRLLFGFGFFWLFVEIG